jgi:hypothetical protein
MFRYRAYNVFGWSAYSDIISQIAAKRPDAPAIPSTTNIGTSVMIQWVKPYNGGSVVTAYNV